MTRRERLTNTLVRKLEPRAREYTLCDSLIPSLGVRVHPSGGRSFIHVDGRKRVSLGPVSLKTVGQARAESIERLTRRGEDDAPIPCFRDFASGPWRDSWVHHCKPTTIRWRDRNLVNRLLPTFGSLRLDRITPALVHRWFDDFSRTAPSGANHCLKTLRHIFSHAVSHGHIAANPARNVRPNRRPKLTRFLSQDEVHRLHDILDRYDNSRTITLAQRMQIDIIRLLMFTGCRKGEIVRLRRDEIVGNRLRLSDSKTGPRTVFLNAGARSIIERRLKGSREYVFPSPNDGSRPIHDGLSLWYRVRSAAGLDDVRIHDLRHTFASHAVMQRTPLPVVARLLGHSQTTMTLRYAHMGDRETEGAAERIGISIAGMLEMD